MFQIYLLAVIINIFGGALLAAGFFREKFPAFGGIEDFLSENRAYVILVSMALIIVGILKFIVPASATASVAQDLIPALAALISGITLFYGYYRKVSDIETEKLNFMDRYIYKYRDVIGILTVLSGIVHFILPRIILL